jgi:hypothetical protein
MHQTDSVLKTESVFEDGQSRSFGNTHRPALTFYGVPSTEDRIRPVALSKVCQA